MAVVARYHLWLSGEVESLLPGIVSHVLTRKRENCYDIWRLELPPRLMSILQVVFPENSLLFLPLWTRIQSRVTLNSPRRPNGSGSTFQTDVANQGLGFAYSTENHIQLSNLNKFVAVQAIHIHIHPPIRLPTSQSHPGVRGRFFWNQQETDAKLTGNTLWANKGEWEERMVSFSADVKRGVDCSDGGDHYRMDMCAVVGSRTLKGQRRGVNFTLAGGLWKWYLQHLLKEHISNSFRARSVGETLPPLFLIFPFF